MPKYTRVIVAPEVRHLLPLWPDEVDPNESCPNCPAHESIRGVFNMRGGSTLDMLWCDTCGKAWSTEETYIPKLEIIRLPRRWEDKQPHCPKCKARMEIPDEPSRFSCGRCGGTYDRSLCFRWS